VSEVKKYPAAGYSFEEKANAVGKKGYAGRRPFGGNADSLWTENPAAPKVVDREVRGGQGQEGSLEREILFEPTKRGEDLGSRKTQESKWP